MILEAAGVSTGSMYNHFRGGKDELVNEVYQDCKARINSVLWDRFPVDQPFRKQYEEWWRRLGQLARDEVTSLVFVELHHHGDYLNEESRVIESRVAETGLSIIRAGQRDAAVRELPASLLFQMVWGSYLGIVNGIRAGRLRPEETTFTDAERATWDMIRA